MRTGIWQTEEYKRSQSKTMKLVLANPEIRKRISENTKLAIAKPEIKQRMIKGKLGHTVNQETKDKISQSVSQSYIDNPNLIQTRINQMQGKKRNWSPSKEQINSIKRSLTGIKKTPEHKERTRQAAIKSWQNPEIRDRMFKAIPRGDSHYMKDEKNLKRWLKAIHAKPNKVERKLNLIIQSIKRHEFALNVRGNIMILGGKVPDFCNINGRKLLIELYGNYFHKGENPEHRINYFKKFGYDTLIIWENELKDRELVSNKVSNWLVQ